MKIRTLIAVGALVIASPFVAPANVQETFHGCSGHQAGYDWAQRNDIADESDCNSNSQSFNEGCQAYV